MKKNDLKVGMIVEDRSEYSQINGYKFQLIVALHPESGHYSYIGSNSPDNFRPFKDILTHGIHNLRTNGSLRYDVRHLRLIR